MKKINKEKVAERLKKVLEEWENNADRMRSGYDYEKTFVTMMKQFEQELFQESMGDIPSKNFKKK
jgi:hypothetical protein